MGRRSGRTIAVAAALSALIGLAACGSSGGSGRGQNPSSSPATGGSSAKLKDVSLMLSFVYGGHFADLFYGVKKGIYKKYGINLSIEPGKGSVTTVQAVATGHVDFGWADSGAMITAVNKGVKARSLGAFEQVSSAAVICFADEHIDKPSDLVGKKIAITPGDSLSATFPAFLRANGLKESDVTIVHVAASAKVALLAQHKVNCMVALDESNAPAAAQQSGDKVDSLLYGDWGVPMLGAGLLTSDSLIAKDPELVSAMMKATVESITGAAQHPEEAIDAMESVVGEQLPARSLLLDQLQRHIKILYAPGDKNRQFGLNTTEQWETTAKTLQENGVIDKVLPVDQYWYNTEK